MLPYVVVIYLSCVASVLGSFSPDAEQRCLECCTKAVTIAPQNPEAHQVMASYLLSKDDIEVGHGSLGLWSYGVMGV